jgi:hypothetical protein
MPTDIVLEDTAVIIDGPALKIRGADLELDHPPKRGGSLLGQRRAIVHGEGDVLQVNFAGDYRGGAQVQGKLLVDVPFYRPATPGSEPRYEMVPTELGATLRLLMDQVEALREQAELLQIRATITADADHYTQAGWRWCDACSALHFEPNRRRGLCPATKGSHSSGKSRAYQLFVTRSRYGGQRGWGWCRKCQAICHGTYPLEGHCPVGGEHDRSESPAYLLWAAEDSYRGAKAKTFPSQDQWRRCSRCSGLFHGATPGVCSAPGGGAHQGDGSPNYHLEC